MKENRISGHELVKRLIEEEIGLREERKSPFLLKGESFEDLIEKVDKKYKLPENSSLFSCISSGIMR